MIIQYICSECGSNLRLSVVSRDNMGPFRRFYCENCELEALMAVESVFTVEIPMKIDENE